jgi:ABC-type dipeptide/oligopeptide/nickel transport system permease subunit
LRTSLAALACHRLILAGTLLLGILAMLAIAAPTLTRLRILHDPNQQDMKGVDEDGMPLPLGSGYLLGTDNLGRDVLSRVIQGGRISLSIGVAAMLTATLIGVAVGLAAGYYGGKLDVGLMRFTDMNMAIPAILLAIAFAGLIDVEGRIIHLHPAGLPWHFLDLTLKRGTVSIFLIIGWVCWPGMVRVIRAQALAVKEQEFVQAARALGASNARILLGCILPNLMPTVIVLAVMSTANTILLEAGLGYLGVGVPPPAATWGSMISDGQPYFATFPHLVIVPGLAIVFTVLAFNLLGQGLQEIIDPKQTR